MKCTDCGGSMKVERVVRAYDADVPDVVVDGLERGTCPKCGSGFEGHPRPLELSALILGALIGKRSRLAPSEVRHLRKSIGLRAQELAETIGVTPTQVSRWENGVAPISALADRLLRMLVASFHQVPAPVLRGIDMKRSDPVRLRLELGRKGWKLAEPIRVAS